MLIYILCIAFPVGFDGLQYVGWAHGERWEQNNLTYDHTGTSEEAWAQANFDGIGIDAETGLCHGESSFDPTGNGGLYWFWDPTWSDTQPHP